MEGKIGSREKEYLRWGGTGLDWGSGTALCEGSETVRWERGRWQ